MFEKGDYVICGNNGICSVSDVTTLNISCVDKNRKYYLLKPIYQSGSTIYIPVDTSGQSLRRALTKQEADLLIASIPDIPLIPLADEKTLERTYKEYMHEGTCEFCQADQDHLSPQGKENPKRSQSNCRRQQILQTCGRLSLWGAFCFPGA